MKIRAWFSRGMYPLDMLEKDGLFSLFFVNEEGETADRVLLTGISGVGKSTLLRGIGDAWTGLGQLLSGKAPSIPSGNAALLLDDLLDTPFLLCYAPESSFWDSLAERNPSLPIMGMRGAEVICPPETKKALSTLLNGAGASPNMLLLVDENQLPYTDDLSGYTVTLSQVEAFIRTSGGFPKALARIAKESPDCIASMREQLNTLLSGKQLEGKAENYQVLTRRGALHAPEALSSGERRMLLLLFAAWAALHPGGILLVDEPESHIHPSQVLGLLTTLEQQATRHGGQLLLSSHLPQVWRRYENVGLVVQLEGQA